MPDMLLCKICINSCTLPGTLSSVQSLSHVWLCDPMDCNTPHFCVHHKLLELTQTQFIKSVMPSNHLILCCPLHLLPSVFPSIRVFSNESVLHIRWSKYWSFSFSISPSNEYSGLISLRIDWFDLLAVQGTLKSLLQHHISKASVLHCSTFFIIHHMLSRLVIAFLPRHKRLSISCLQSPSAEILETKKMKSLTVSTVFPFICQEGMGPDAMILLFWMLSFKPTFSLCSFTFIKGSLVPLHFLP